MSMHKQYKVIVAALASGFLMASCGSSNGTTEQGDDGPAAEQRRQMLGAVGEQTVTLYANFDAELDALDTAVDAWAQEPTNENRIAAQQAWKSAIFAWQQAEVTQYGPAGAMSAVEGGEDLRDRIYSWPLTNTCRVDQELAAEGYAAAGFVDERINVKGLDALEYLLFATGEENTCSPNSTINTDGSWDALDATELQTRRAEYSSVLVDELIGASDDLIRWWSPDGENFQAELETAGAGSEVYPSSQEALNAVSDALFYIEKETKDMKVAPPIGLTTCTESSCPELRESQFANVSIENVRHNLDGFAAVYFAGFDPLLREKGAVELADEMKAKLEAAQTAFAGLDSNIVTMLEEDRTSLVEAHDLLREFVLVFRTQFLSVLDLELPQRVEGDND